jgi:endoglucanase
MSIEKIKDKLIGLERIVSTPSVSGNEYHFNSKLVEQYNEWNNKYNISKDWKIKIDNMDNVIFSKGNSKNKFTLLFAAHKDKVGFIVENIRHDGYVELARVGGLPLTQIVNSRIVLYNKKITLIGTLKIQIDKNDIRKSQVYGDFGYKSKLEIGKFVKLGDPVMFYPDFLLVKDHIISPYMDNSIGVFTCIAIIDYFITHDLDINIIVAFTSQEEVGLRGIKSVLKKTNPDLSIIIDTTGVSKTVELGGGVTLILFDYGIILPKNIQKKLEEIAKKSNIPYQLEVYSKGGTSDWEISSIEGHMTLPIGIPVKNIHTLIETVSIKDLNHLIKYVIKLGESFDEFREIKEFRDIKLIELSGPKKLSCPNCYIDETKIEDD